MREDVKEDMIKKYSIMSTLDLCQMMHVLGGYRDAGDESVGETLDLVHKEYQRRLVGERN